MASHCEVRGIPECLLVTGLRYSNLPEMAMAVLYGPVGLFLACALSSRLLLQAEGNLWGGPCEEQQRYRQHHAEPEVVSGSTVAILGILGGLMILVQFVFRFINKDQCPQERKECQKPQEDCQESSRKTDKGRYPTCNSQALVCSPAGGEPYPSGCSQTQQAYVRQLACMEQQLEALLHEVRSQKNTLKDTMMEKENFPNTTENGSNKLHITVYEIADCEDFSNLQPRGRKRHL